MMLIFGVNTKNLIFGKISIRKPTFKQNLSVALLIDVISVRLIPLKLLYSDFQQS